MVDLFCVCVCLWVVVHVVVMIFLSVSMMGFILRGGSKCFKGANGHIVYVIFQMCLVSLGKESSSMESHGEEPSSVDFGIITSLACFCVVCVVLVSGTRLIFRGG